MELVLVLAGVDETVELLRMPVEIKDKLDVWVLCDEPFHGIDLRMHPLVGFQPLTVDVVASEVGPEVAVDDAVNIEHRDEDDLELLEDTGLQNDRFDEGFHNVGRDSLAGVLSGEEKDLARWFRRGEGVEAKVGNGVVGEGVAQDFGFEGSE